MVVVGGCVGGWGGVGWGGVGWGGVGWGGVGWGGVGWGGVGWGGVGWGGVGWGGVVRRRAVRCPVARFAVDCEHRCPARRSHVPFRALHRATRNHDRRWAALLCTPPSGPQALPLGMRGSTVEAHRGGRRGAGGAAARGCFPDRVGRRGIDVNARCRIVWLSLACAAAAGPALLPSCCCWGPARPFRIRRCIDRFPCLPYQQSLSNTQRQQCLQGVGAAG